jgi:site-specific recombinase XerD
MTRMTVGPKRSRSKERKKPAVSFAREDWLKLRTALRDDPELEGAVLRVMMATSVRIQDILLVRLDAIRAALRHDDGLIEVIQKGGSRRMLPVAGAHHEWSALLAHCKQANAAATIVAEAVCPASSWGAKGGGGAYQRVRRHLQAVSDRIGIDGRVHLHRIRRTVATTALRHTKDIKLVAEMLGHKHVSTTEIYVDEARSDDVAALQRQLMEDP